jgi:recombination protein RecA
MAEKKKSPSKHVESDASVDRDELALIIQKELNKAQKDGTKVSFFLDEDDNPVEVREWVGTGSTLLDLAISNRPHGGFPVGRMVELSGLESTGKSLMCAQIIAETQKRGGLAVFFDSESSVDKTFWTALGVNIRNVNYQKFTTLEELFTMLELVIGAFRKKDDGRLLTIFIDSVAQASVESEMESQHGVSGYNTGKSIVLSKAMRKITNLVSNQRVLIVYTNQVRYNMNAGPFGDKWVVPGGKALPFACSVRIRLANLGKLKVTRNGQKEVIGMKCTAQLIKNRCGPGYRTAQFEIHYDSGIQDLSSWLVYMKLHGIVTGDKSGYTFKRADGTKVEFDANKFVELMTTDAALKEEVYQAICAKYIMAYRDPNSKIVEDVETEAGENDDITKSAVKEDADSDGDE